jgi:hypothetical protein
MGSAGLVNDGTLDRMVPVAHASITQAWARPSLVFCVAATISTAFEMAHHVLAVIRQRPTVVIQVAPGSIAAVNCGATARRRAAGRLSDQLGFSPFHHRKSA